MGQYTALCNAVTISSCIFLDILGLTSNSKFFSGLDMEAICLICNELKLQEDVVLLLFIGPLKFEYTSNNSTLYFLSRIFCKPISAASKHLLRLSLYLCSKNQFRNV